MRQYIHITILFSAICIALVGCKPKARKAQTFAEVMDSTSAIVTYGGTLFPVPSSWEVFELLHHQQLEFAPELLNPTRNATRYTTSAKQALNLGVWAAEMSYLNAYNKSQQMVETLLSVKRMCAELGLEQAIMESPWATSDEIAEQPQAFSRTISQVFGSISHELGQTERGEVGGLIIAGAWVESIYLLANLAIEHNNREVINRIGDLQQPLNNLIDLLSPYYYKAEHFSQLIDALIVLQQSFKEMIYSYTYAPPTVQAEQKHIVINSKSRVVISDYLLREIARQVGSIRGQIIE